MAETVRIEVVAAEGIAWEGDALSIIARTTEGDVGILPHHEPFLAALVPCVTEISTIDGKREFVAVNEGFISVADNRVSLLAGYARAGGAIDLQAAERELAGLEQSVDSGQADDDTLAKLKLAQVQVRAAHRAAEEL
ncbi:MAG: F0F1 ATP synthase subunit epsilon [Propionibacteriaceae bacterium]|jgi:F-type H+-transporting ATPase subunit epsilon|nr:F0F1 ATP synthase subunit epsilon [Propionibacteriaceae bacterium]